MINEVSQSLLGTLGAPATGASGNTGKVQESQSVDVLRSVSSAGSVVPGDDVATVPVDEKRLEEMVDDLNEFARTVRRQLHFSVDEDSGKVVVKVIDAETKTTIREIPPEEIRNMQKHLGEVNGLLFHTKA